MSMKVKDLIVTEVTACTLEDDVRRARDLMDLKKISALPVVSMDNGKSILEGIVSFQDLAGVYDDTVNIRQVMSTKIYAIKPETSVQNAAKIMLSKGIHHLIAMEGDQIVGMISSMDFVKLVSELEI